MAEFQSQVLNEIKIPTMPLPIFADEEGVEIICRPGETRTITDPDFPQRTLVQTCNSSGTGWVNTGSGIP